MVDNCDLVILKCYLFTLIIESEYYSELENLRTSLICAIYNKRIRCRARSQSRNARFMSNSMRDLRLGE